MYKVYYIMHSCFLVELDDRYLLFDYFDKEVVRDVVDFKGGLPELDPGKCLYVFASHSHKDHWWLENLRWGTQREMYTISCQRIFDLARIILLEMASIFP